MHLLVPPRRTNENVKIIFYMAHWLEREVFLYALALERAQEQDLADNLTKRKYE